jgi:hypothetical protein
MQTDPFADFSHQISNRKSGIRIPRNLLKNKEPKQSLIAKKSRFLNPIFLLSSLPRRSLTATADPTRIGILSYHRESKEVICGNMETLRAAEPVKFLTATVDLQDFTQLAQNTPLSKILTATKTTFSALQLLSRRTPLFLLRCLSALLPLAAHVTIRVHTLR